MVHALLFPCSPGQGGDFNHISGQGAGGMGLIHSSLVPFGKTPLGSLSFLSGRPLKKSLCIGFPDRIPMEHLVLFPKHQNALVGPLPEVQGGYILVGVVPDQPPAGDGEGNPSHNQCQGFAKSIDKHGTVRF